MPLFETSASSAPAEAEALVNITPGVFNNLTVGDRVFVTFEENAIEKPIILGKLFRGAEIEGSIRGGGALFNTLKVGSDASLPSSTNFVFPATISSTYKELNTPKGQADYIKRLESFIKSNLTQLEGHFTCFKNWTQWQLMSENVEIDDGDLDTGIELAEPFQYQEEGKHCNICKTCTKDGIRSYQKLAIDKN
jgi:hypothetical protein